MLAAVNVIPYPPVCVLPIKNPVLYIDLVSKGTVDEKIIKALRNKVNIASQINGEELTEWI